jgi:hypothetical protein
MIFTSLRGLPTVPNNQLSVVGLPMLVQWLTNVLQAIGRKFLRLFLQQVINNKHIIDCEMPDQIFNSGSKMFDKLFFEN